MNRETDIKLVVENKELSVKDKIERILSIQDSVEADSVEYYKLGCTVFETIRTLLLNDNYEECHLDDLLMCDCLLAEAYWHTSKGWCIAPLAQEIYDKLVGLFVKDAEKLQAYSQVIARICYCLQGTGHPRLMMKLLVLRIGYEKLLPEPDREELEAMAEKMLNLSLLTQCDTWYKVVETDILDLLSSDKIDAIKRAPADGLLKVDPVEYTELWEKVIDEVEAKVNEELADEPKRMGHCFTYWTTKARVLRDYGIEWKSPSLMNPRVVFD